jgi:phenylpropionate dioxygenase-like ring-hydroxylating dioxygenase large terminal subunit
MVYRPTRGDAPPRLGPGVRQLPDVPGSTVSADVYRDRMRYELERDRVLRASWLIAGRSSEMPTVNDWLLYEGHGDTVIVTRQADGSVAAFHNVCQHRGAALNGVESSGCDRRFTCPWHGWVYDTTGLVVGVPEREDFDPRHLEGLRAPAVAADEWGGWVWINLAGPQHAPALRDWIGPDIIDDLGKFRMEDMTLLDKLVIDIPVNYKAIVDGFNEVYHVTALHHVAPEFTKSARDTSFHLTGPNSMMFVPRPDRRDDLRATGDHHKDAICHYVIFPNSVFNNNPDQIQLFQPIPLAEDRTRFICWELVYTPAGDDDPEYDRYIETTRVRWEELQRVVGEDLYLFEQLARTRHSMGYRENIFSTRECKPTSYHETMDHCVQGGSPMDRWQDHPAGNSLE